MFKLVIATPLYPPDIGGPATYAKALEEAFPQHGISVRVVSFHTVRHLPKGISHLAYAIKLFLASKGGGAIIALDPVSVGLSAVVVGNLRAILVYARIGGDTLWERYVTRTQEQLPLSTFYELQDKQFTLKEGVMFALIKFFIRHAAIVCFSTEWQRRIWEKPYGLSPNKTRIIKNAFPRVEKDIPEPKEKVFLWAGRDIPLKNLAVLRRAFTKAKETHPDIKLEIVTGISHEALSVKMQSAYALMLPSLADISPNFILEGVSMGKPFVMTEETGVKEDLAGFGIFIDPLNEDALVRAIEDLASANQYALFRERMRRQFPTRSYADIAQEFSAMIVTKP